ncbi:MULTISPECIES: hypothetical protein [Thiorhodovibrio]|uniref:hypothetical protein n=1 Tax=Thiorhodovibrio TaxID=61593 RepID=UPI001911416F|nr:MULTISPECIES: hypothetical protein [Thiorhodovibrio]
MVIGRGRMTGLEHGVAVFPDSRMISFGGMSAKQLPVPNFRESDYAIVLHHNHPLGDSLSRADLRLLLGRQDLVRVDVHGHAGFWASCQRIGLSLPGPQATLTVSDAASRAISLVERAVVDRKIDHATGSAGLWLVVMALLLELDGVLVYTLNSSQVRAMAETIIQ